jgi:hypothetical protein
VPADPGDTARFDRIGGHPVNDQALFDDVRRDSEGGIGFFTAD